MPYRAFFKSLQILIGPRAATSKCRSHGLADGSVTEADQVLDKSLKLAERFLSFIPRTPELDRHVA